MGLTDASRRTSRASRRGDREEEAGVTRREAGSGTRRRIDARGGAGRTGARPAGHRAPRLGPRGVVSRPLRHSFRRSCSRAVTARDPTPRHGLTRAQPFVHPGASVRRSRSGVDVSVYPATALIPAQANASPRHPSKPRLELGATQEVVVVGSRRVAAVAGFPKDLGGPGDAVVPEVEEQAGRRQQGRGRSEEQGLLLAPRPGEHDGRRSSGVHGPAAPAATQARIAAWVSGQTEPG
jgi:hypothetical protein